MSKHQETHDMPDTPIDRTVERVRAWLKQRHIMLYQRNRVNGVPTHCECCGVGLLANDVAYYWLSMDTPVTYRLCSYCDRQAFHLTKQFVIRLKHALYNPDEDIPGWPARKRVDDE